MFNVSAAMAAEFIKHTKTMTDQLKDIGHNPLRSKS
jgi:coenzyme F420-reducing hydrogenase delta subunit